MDDSVGMWKPPYFSFQTFWAFMGDLAAKPLPPRIDRSLLKSKSGTDQMNLLSALRAFDLVNDENVVSPELLAPIAQGEEGARADALGDLVRRHYGKALDLSEQNGTDGQLQDLFRDNFGIASADTRRKAVTFFLHAARKAGIELSQHFPTTRSGSGAPGAPRVAKRAAVPRRPKPMDAGSPASPVLTSEQTPAGEHKEISFGGAGQVTVTVAVRWLDLPDEIFTGLRRVIRDLEDLGAPTDPREP